MSALTLVIGNEEIRWRSKPSADLPRASQPLEISLTANANAELFDSMVFRLTALFSTFLKQYGLPKTAPELSAIALAFFVFRTVIRSAPLRRRYCSGDARNELPVLQAQQLQELAELEISSLRDLAEARIPQDTSEEHRTNLLKFLDSLQRTYLQLRELRTKDCIQIIEGFDCLRASVTNPKDIPFGTFECWVPFCDACDDELVQLQKNSTRMGA